MMYYSTCKECGANLDPGEKCDCEEEKNIKKIFVMKNPQKTHKRREWLDFGEGNQKTCA